MSRTSRRGVIVDIWATVLVALASCRAAVSLRASLGVSSSGIPNSSKLVEAFLAPRPEICQGYLRSTILGNMIQKFQYFDYVSC